MVSAPDRADIGGIARENESNPGIGDGNDLHGAAAVIEAEHGFAGHFILKADAARALDAAFAVQPDQLAQRHLLVQMHLSRRK